MSKTFAGICVTLLTLILVVQLITLFVGVRKPKVTVVPRSAKANLASPDAYYDPCYLGTCTGGAPQFQYNSSDVRVLDENGNCLPGGC